MHSAEALGFLLGATETTDFLSRTNATTLEVQEEDCVNS